jgi:NTE family protein
MTGASSRPTIGLVLSGGAARGAYEAGVIAYLREGLPAETGVHARFDVICGTSVGAINACFLAATADRPDEQGALLAASWSTLEIENVVAVTATDLARFARSLVGRAPSLAELHLRGGIINPERLERVVREQVRWSQIERNLARGHLAGLAVSATHVASGETVVFVHRRDGVLPPWSHDPWVHARASAIRPHHALASAALPLLFPAVEIDGRYYCDGGVRQNTPLSPALRLGADRVLVVSLRHRGARDPEGPGARLSLPDAPRGDEGSAESAPSPFFLLGKVLNALLLDHLDYDVARLEATNAVLDAGARAFGGGFVDGLNTALAAQGANPMRRVEALIVRPSQDLGELAARFAQTDAFASRARGLTGGLLRRLARAESRDEADLVSYLLFDGEFGRSLIELGVADARARRDDLARFFDGG